MPNLPLIANLKEQIDNDIRVIFCSNDRKVLEEFLPPTKPSIDPQTPKILQNPKTKPNTEDP